MATQFVSMSEIMRVAPWSLRALGQPFGVAERGTRLLTWTEAAVGHALKLLRVGEDALRQSSQAPAARRSDEHGRSHINANGRNLIEQGPPAVDLAVCDARRMGQGDVIIENVIGSLMVPALADLIARRGLTGIVSFRNGVDEIRMKDCPSEGWVGAFVTASGPVFATGSCADLPSVAELFEGETRLQLLDHATYLGGKPGAGTGIVAVAVTAESARQLPGATVTYRERVAKAYREGLEVALEDLAHLYALERITWAPTSERSRKQAGY